ncbi:MAG TPA: efflux RND transporter periplasmic adaptor subunit [Candidatus Omnitrophota bacterium]|nr:efflux RND transporter periplasmic adaptor subunit [Candidatus Omnitrophota bacterium]
MQSKVDLFESRFTTLEETTCGKNKENLLGTRSYFLLALFPGIFILALAVTGCKLKDVPPQQGPEVAVVTMQPERVAITTELPGRTAPFLVAEIRPQVNGLIQKRLFTEGSEIKIGQELYQIDPAPFQAAFDRAKANLPAIQFRADRYKEALVDKAVSQQDFDDADAALKQVKAELQTARINLDYTHIVSPITGRIGTSTVTEGAIVTAYQPKALATVQQLDPIYVDIPESTTELLRFQRHLKVGRLDYDEANQNKVKLTLDDGTPYPEDGALQFKDITVDPTTGSVILRAVFPNPEGILLPGMFVRAIITEGVNEQALLVPQQGVARNSKGDPLALIVDAEEKVQQRMLTLDRAIGDKWLVLSGLEPGDRVIVEGVLKVRPGVFVKAIPFDSAPKDNPGVSKTVQPSADSD